MRSIRPVSFFLSIGRPHQVFLGVILGFMMLLGGIVNVMILNGRSLMSTGGFSQTKASKVTVDSITKALRMYAIDHGGLYPDGDQDVWKLLMQKTANQSGILVGPYLDELPKDAWGEVLHYRYPPGRNAKLPDIWSLGPDIDDPKDNIGNWP